MSAATPLQLDLALLQMYPPDVLDRLVRRCERLGYRTFRYGNEKYFRDPWIGLAVAAHLGPHGTEAWVRQLKDDGVDGVEVRHPSHDLGDEKRLVEIAERLDLAITGGSDWHGDEDQGTSHTDLGDLDIPVEWLEALERRKTR